MKLRRAVYRVLLAGALSGCGGSGGGHTLTPAFRVLDAPSGFVPTAFSDSGALIGNGFQTATVGFTLYLQSAYRPAGGKLAILPTLNGSPEIYAGGINGNDQIVGFCNLEPVAWLHPQSSAPETIPWPTGFGEQLKEGTFLQTEFINNHDQILGNATNGDAQTDTAYLWRTPASVPTIVGPAQFQVTGFNNQGIAVGYLSVPNRNEFYKVDVNGNLSTDLHFVGPNQNMVCVIDDSGTIALGESPESVSNGFDSDLVVISPSGTSSVVLNSAYPVAINSRGDIVGQQMIPSSGENDNPFLYKPGRPIINLNTFIPASEGFTKAYVTGINDQGEVLGWGAKGNENVSFIIRLPSGDY